MNTSTSIFKPSQNSSFPHFLKYPIYVRKNTSLLKQMTVETDLCRNEHYSCMKVVAFSQSVKAYPMTQCKFLLNLKIGYKYTTVKSSNIQVFRRQLEGMCVYSGIPRR